MLNVIQYSFNSGEWSPQLNARVDLAKYSQGAALLRNFFVDYRGGASTRTGTKYILQAKIMGDPVRLIPFQASIDVGYILEFGDEYIRFYANGAPVLEDPINITGVTKATPAVVSVVNSYAVGDTVFISGVVGMTQLNNKYFRVGARTGTTISLQDLRGNNINSTAYGTWTSGGTTRRVYTLTSPYDDDDLRQLKFAQNVNDLVICHPEYEPHILHLIESDNWTITPIAFGSTVDTPTNVVVSTTLNAGSANYSYIVTAVDANGQESNPSVQENLNSREDLRTVAATNTIEWDAVSGATSYNVYKADISYTGPVPVGVQFGFIGNSTAAVFNDSNIAPDFSQGIPIPRSPFAAGASVASVSVVSGGSFTAVPTITLDAAPAGGITATVSGRYGGATASVDALNTGTGYSVGNDLTLTTAGFGNIIVNVDSVGGGGEVLTVSVIDPGSGTVGPFPSGSSLTTGGAGTGARIQVDTWTLLLLSITNSGAGYLVTPNITFSPGGSGAAAQATLSAMGISNPTLPGFFQQRLVLAGTTNDPQTLFLSQPGSYYNFNITNPTAGGDSISGTLVSGVLNNLKSLVVQTSGLLVLSDSASWLINGGSPGSAISPDAFVANAQSFNGTTDVPPIVANADVLYVQSKGSAVRNSSYNFYSNVFTGTDISIVSSHLFFGKQILEWCWAEEPFKVAWAVQDDGTLLSLTYMKEQEFIAWAHSDTLGTFESIATIVELTDMGYVNAVYVAVEREVDGDDVIYIERFTERYYPNGKVDAWQVDAGLQYNGAPATSFSGGEHLAGLTVTGLADGAVITPFVMAASGDFTLPVAASKVTVGIAFTPQLQTLAIDIKSGQETIQGKTKKVNAVIARVFETLELYAGPNFDTNEMKQMQDLIDGNVSSMLTGQLTQVLDDLITGDANIFLTPAYTVPGQYCFEQRSPYPVTILGTIPDIVIGDR